MARTKDFDETKALDAAMSVFREHGFEGSSARMLVESMEIGRQSLYDTYGDKWQLYLAALRRYATTETEAHLAALQSGPRAIDGIDALLERVVRLAALPCLGVGSVCEFGTRSGDISAINAGADQTLRLALVKRVREAQADGDIEVTLEADDVVDFLVGSITGIRVAARGGGTRSQLKGMVQMTMRALR